MYVIRFETYITWTKTELLFQKMKSLNSFEIALCCCFHFIKHMEIKCVLAPGAAA